MSEQGLITHVPTPEELKQQLEIETRVLHARTDEQIETSAVPFTSESIYDGIDSRMNPVVAEIDAVSNRFVVFEDVGMPDDPDRYFLMPAVAVGKDDEGKYHFSAIQSIPLKLGVPFEIGRNKLEELGLGRLARPTLSRVHAELLIDGAGLHITQKSKTNDTNVTYAKEVLSPLEQRRDELERQKEELRTKYDEATQKLIWDYAAGLLNKRDAQERDDGQGSIAWGQIAGQAWMAMSEDARKDAERYKVLMDESSRLGQQLADQQTNKQ